MTTIVDAGSAGSATFSGFTRHILPHCHTEIIPFLHICQTGLATMPDIVAESSINLDDTLDVLNRHQGLIGGIKARMVSPALEIMGMEMPRLAKRAARESGTRLMVHIGDTEKRYDAKVIHSLLPSSTRAISSPTSSPPIREVSSTATASSCPRRARRGTAECGSTPRTGGRTSASTSGAA